MRNKYIAVFFCIWMITLTLAGCTSKDQKTEQRIAEYARVEAELRLEYMNEYLSCTKEINAEDIQKIISYATTLEYGDSLIALDDIMNRHGQLMIDYSFWDKGKTVTYQNYRDEIFDLTYLKLLCENSTGEWADTTTVIGVDRELVFSAFGFGMGQVDYIRSYENPEKLKESLSLAIGRISEKRETHIQDKKELEQLLKMTDEEVTEVDIPGLTREDFEEK